MRRLVVAIVVALSACACHTPPKPVPDAGTIEVAENQTIFTLFALLNAAGYDEENRSAMHPVRVKVREELNRRLDPELRARLHRFYAAHPNASGWSYSVVAMATSGPPEFTPTREWEEIKSDEQFGALAELHPLLREFYAKADVPKLYAPVRSDYVAYAKAYEATIKEQVEAVRRYCRVVSVGSDAKRPEGEPVNALVIPNLLESYEKAFSFVLANRFTSVEGPQTRIGYNPHEFVHAITNPAVYGPATAALEPRLRPIAEAVKAGSVAALVDEDLVRAISLRYLAVANPEKLDKLAGAMMAEYRDGHPLERFFWDQLAEFERGSADIRAYYPAMLNRLDPDAELRRWREAGGSP